MNKRGSLGLAPQRSRSQRQYNDQMVTGSLSLGGASVYSSQQPPDDTKQSTKYSSDRDDQRPTKSIEKSSSLFSMPSRKDSSRKSSTDGATTMPMTMSLATQSHHNEPQLTPSISNIGGAVLRSKTADFERLLMQNKNSGSGSSSGGESGLPITVADMGHTVSDANTGGQVKKQPIYKRRELISSVQSSKK